ncbi:MAG: response regulator [bacterium]
MIKILIAEDDKFLANAYRVKFELEGFEVLICLDGVETIQALATFTPDLILLDLVMPQKDGFQVLAELKHNTSWKNIPVVVTSNLSQTSDFERAKQLGAVDFFVKSDTPINNIVEKVRNYLK